MAVFSNQATLSYNGETINSNVVTGEIVDVLTATKSSVGDGYTQGDTVTYAVNIVNTGNTPITGVTVTDNLGEYEFGADTRTPLTYREGTATYFADGVEQTATAAVTDDGLVISGITVPANGVVTVLYEADANGFAPLGDGGQILNRATVASASLTSPLTAQDLIAANTEPDLSITKSVNPQQVPENGQLTYTFLIENRGTTAVEEAGNITVADNFNPVLSDITAALNGTALTEGADYTYDTATGTFATLPGRIAVPAAAVNQNAATGEYTAAPGTATLTVTGTV